jgi:filamentous hemagglutinin
LSADQVAALTSDIVWLVEKDITLPNGEHTRALVPELYARVREGDVSSKGALLSAREVNLTTSENLTNSGQIAAGLSVSLSGNNVRNLGGQITSRTVAIGAANDIDNIGGQIQARDALVIRAGRDINVVSTTHTNENATSRRTTVDRVASLSVTGSTAGTTPADNNPTGGPGILVAVAGRDMNLTAAAIVNEAKPSSPYASNTSTTSTTNLIAGNNVNLTTVSEDSANHIVWDKKNQRRDSQRTDVGTQIHTQGDVQIASGHDVNLNAATVHSKQGTVSIDAARNIVVAAGSSERHVDEVHEHTEHGMVSSTTRRERDVLHENAAQASTVSGHNVELYAGNDAWVTGSHVISTAGTSILANNNVTIEAATNTQQATHTFQQKTSGLMSSGGFGVTLGHRKQSENTTI